MYRLLYGKIFALVAAVSGLMLPPVVAAGDHRDAPWPATYRYVSFPVGDDVATSPIQLAGRFSLPPPALNGAPWPAVVIVHGSGGVDSRGPLYAKRLNEAGIATLEVDMWTARNLRGGLDRPHHVAETLPDAGGALRFLAGQPEIDPDRIGLMGFSWGGVVAMLIANGNLPHQDSTGYAAVVALYPVCWGYNRVPGYDLKQITRPLLIIGGQEDQYDQPGDCEALVSSLPAENQTQVELHMLAGATHAFDRRAPETRFNDPFAFRGEGGEVAIRYNPAATQTSLKMVQRFFSGQLQAANPAPQSQDH